MTVSETDDEVVFYRTNDGLHDFKFWFKNCGDDGWRSYIMSKIDYCGHNSNLHSTHRTYDSSLCLHYIDWCLILSFKYECKQIAALWSECTVHYINDGKSF